SCIVPQLPVALDLVRVDSCRGACCFRDCLRDNFGLWALFGWFTSTLGYRDWLASSSEPIVASGAAYLLLGVILTAIQYLGGAMIILAVVLLASRKVGETPNP